MLKKGTHEARCILQGHPIGIEARVVIDGEVHGTEAIQRTEKSSAQMINATWAWRVAFEARAGARRVDMLSNLFFVLSVLCLFAIAYFAIGMGKPSMRFVGTRRRALICVGGSFVGLVAFAAVGQATMTPEQRREMEERRAARNAKYDAEQAQKAQTAAAPTIKDGERLISQQNYGDEWPLTVPEGVLSCVDEGLKRGVKISSVLFRTGSTVYGLNGTAKDKGYPAPTPILKTQSLGSVQPVARLSEAQRRRIFASIVACEDGNPGDRALSQACKARLQRAERISAEELKTIGYEGATASWPPLDPSYMSVQPLITQGLSLCVA